MKAKVIVNPAAKSGASGRHWPQVEARLGAALGEFDVAFTTAPGHATDIARGALGQGCDHFIAVGGDGTVNEVMNGIMHDGALIEPDTMLCPIPAGTANELCRALGLLSDAEAPYRAIVNGNPRRMDVCRVTCGGLDGGTVHRGAYLIVSFGSAAEISHRTSTSRYIKKLGGEISYYLVTIIVTLAYKPKQLRIVIDDHFDDSIPVHSGLCCNTENGGGGMKLAPGASYDDGVLDLVVFGDMKPTDFLLQKPSWLFEGRHVRHPGVRILRGTKFTVEGDTSVLVDADGETIGRLPLAIEVVPNALNVKN